MVLEGLTLEEAEEILKEQECKNAEESLTLESALMLIGRIIHKNNYESRT